MEESVAGFRRRGTWGDVVEHGERITRALRDAGAADREAFAEWDEWRPKAHERVDDVNRKTAQQASVDEGAVEAPDDDLRAAGEKLTESYENVGNGDGEGAVESAREAGGRVRRAADAAGRRAVRAVEDVVYRRVMTKVSPYYFDNGLVSANLDRTTRGDDPFVLEVNINDDELKDAVGERLATYDEEVERWHVDTQKDVDVAEAAEGVEVPPGERDDE